MTRGIGGVGHPDPAHASRRDMAHWSIDGRRR
ncbi:hypothetical protein Ae706Ps2_1388c [Pseudonocardia sp. Ae706_Ps2]|nr:hypothetical protein Ae505Ps2_5024c [Pseudonocardia sp. Ae505_Ps2]OLM22956.1 hypothetical protein Ae706Ps2_1388c [Pseudonocardia sp. Ae706_Ps2]